MKTKLTLLFLLLFTCAGTSFAQWSYSYDEYDSVSTDSSSNKHVSVVVDGTTYGSCWEGSFYFPGCPAQHQSSVHLVLNNTTQGTTTSGGGDGLGNYYGPGYDMFDYMSDQYDTYLFWNPDDEFTSSLEVYVYCAAAALYIFDTGVLTYLPSVACPSSVSISSTTTESLTRMFPNKLTGVGIAAVMLVGPGPNVYNGAKITETLTAGSGTCPSSVPPCGTVTSFTVGPRVVTLTDGSQITIPSNTFEDGHTATSSQSILDQLGINSCSTTCNQTYSCGGSTIGRFQITNSYSKGTIQGTPVTNVTVTKVAQ